MAGKYEGTLLKAEFTFPVELVEKIAEKVVAKLYPLLSEKIFSGNKEDKFLTVKELSNYIGYSTSWIYNNLHKIPHYPVRENGHKKSKPLFRKSEINEWLSNFRKPSDDIKKSMAQPKGFTQQKID